MAINFRYTVTKFFVIIHYFLFVTTIKKTLIVFEGLIAHFFLFKWKIRSFMYMYHTFIYLFLLQKYWIARIKKKNLTV